MKNLSLLTIALLLALVCHSQTPRKINWSSDIDFLASELPQKHYDLFSVKNKKEFITELGRIKSNISQSSDFEVALRLQQFVASFGDSHSSVSYGQLIDRTKVLPLHLYWFKDGLFILHTTQENVEILGHQILSVNGVPLKIVADSLSTLITRDNPSIIKNSVPKLIPSVQVLEYFGFIKGQKVELELKTPEGAKRT